ncbi:MAG: hypothetical protein ACKV0T_05480 [Planctomycetales bacterium]
MIRLTCVVLAVCCISGSQGIAAGKAPTHSQVREVPVPSKEGRSLQTLTQTSEGRIAALIALPRYGAARGSRGGQPTSEVWMLDADGSEVARHSIGFHAQAIGAGPDGSVFVGGNGRLARIDSQGQLTAEIELPHLAEITKNTEELRKRAEEQIESQKESYAEIQQSYEKQLVSLGKRIEDLQEIDEEKRTTAQRRRLKRYEEELSQLRESIDQFRTPSVEEAIQEIISRMRMINSVAVTQRDLFIVCGMSKGYGYSVWRMDHQFQEAREVMSGLGGCCGQMDVQAHGDHLFVAENTKHRVGQYDRDGNPVQTFGQRAEKKAEDGFGGCCNPMNLRIGTDGSIYTAESEGIIRKFNATGEFVDLVGKTKLEHGCKHVAVAVSEDGDRVFFCDQPGSRIVIFAREKSSETE